MHLVDYLRGAGLTQAEFAALAGCTQQDISKYCRGAFPRSREVARGIVSASGGKVSIADLYDPPEPARSGSDGAPSPAPGGTDSQASDVRPAAPLRGSRGRPLSVTSAAGRKAALTRKRRRAATAEAGA